MPEGEILEQLGPARAAYDETSRLAQEARLRQTSLQREKLRAERQGDRAALQAAERELRDAQKAAADLGAAQLGRRREIAGLLAELHRELSPELLTQSWSAELPILLLPLRVETRFKERELLVRVFPDEIATDTHEETLTKREAAAGERYWRAIGADSGATARKEAWRALVDAFKAPRAAYVARRTKPINWADLATVGVAGLISPVETVLKEDSWTQPPVVKVLPDRLVLTLRRAGKVVHRVVGAVLPDVVHVGPAPLTTDGSPSWQRDADGALVFDADSAWLRDFTTAVSMGLGFRVGLRPEDEAGFDELLVLGLKHSADPAHTARLVGELFAGHRYSAKGLALVPQGTATNNTSGDDAGLDSIDWFADASFVAEHAGEAGETPSDLDSASDGWRLAAYLGLDPELFARLPHADAHDHAEAVAMNVALYPGTLGYFLRTMIGEVADEPTLEELRALFTRSVTGRGPLPAVRVGNQPYGVVLAGPPPRSHPGERRRQIDHEVESVIANARHYWTERLPQLARLGGSANGTADLMAVIGLQASSAEYHQRMATTYDHLANLVAFQSGGRGMADVFEAAFAGFAADATLVELGYDVHRPDGTQKPYPLLLQLIYQRHQTLIPPTSLIDGMPFSETETIKPYDAGQTKNYIDWLAANARSADALRAQDFGGQPKPTTLLYMLLRHALLIQAGLSVSLWLRMFDVDAPELVKSRKFVGMTPAIDIAAWEILSAPASAIGVTSRIGTTTNPRSSLPLLAVVQAPEYRTGANAHIGAPIAEILAAYDTLRGLPTARLERLLAEHIDTLSYRLDAWETALIDRRLVRRRGPHPADARRGLYLGAVGYLESVRRAPSGRRMPIDESELHESLRQGAGNLFRLPDDAAGFVHTPSLTHATAAAVLRNGYLTHATPEDPGRLAVDLSSRRVRRAQELMDGVRNGQPLEVLLGVECERAMHDATTRASGPVVLNDLKPALRQAFPIKRTRIPRAGHPDEAPTIVTDFSVVNGLSIIAAADTFPDGVAGLPPLSAARTAELRAIRDRLKDSLDALKDALTAEATYHLALGNFDRSAAIVQSLAAAVMPPDIEVTRSSRGTDLTFTQRLTIELDAGVTANPWAPIAMTPRARFEPPLNAWLGSLIGDPRMFSCLVSLTASGAAPIDTAVRLSDLALQPLDLLQVTRGVRDSAGPQELEARIHAAAHTATGASRSAAVTLTFAESGSSDPAVAPMGDALALLDLAHQVIAGARPIDGRDALTDSKPLPPGTEPSGIAVGELRTRVSGLLSGAATLVTDLRTAVADARLPGAGASQFDALRAVLRRTADAGVPFAFPHGADDTLVGQGERSETALATMRDHAMALETASQDPTLSAPQAADKLMGAVHQLLGDNFRVMPRFVAPNAADLAASDAQREAMLATARGGDASIDPVGEVLTSVAQVRPAVHRLHRLRLMAELTTGSPSLAAVQLPPRQGDVWLGAQLPPGHSIADDTLSLLQLRPQGFAPAAARCGLLVDEWTESFPRSSEVTGISFGFDQPNSAPMQSLLLAVAGDDEKTWDWDALLDTVRDTILRAKLRAVEPGMLDQIPGVTTLVPATMAEFSTSPGALSLDFGLALPTVLVQVAATAYLDDHRAAGTTP